MTYIELDLTVDAGALTDGAVDYMAAQRPGWTPAPGHPFTWMLEAVGFIAAQVAVMAGRVPIAIFQYLGESILRIAVLAATNATATTVWTLTDTLGHTVPAGTQIAVADVAFELVADLVVAPGSSTGTGTVIAVEPGAAGNDLATPVTVLDSLAFVDHVTVTGTTGGGSDGETDVEYVDRVATLTPTLSPKAILIGDFEILPTTVPGVDLALAIDNYIPAGMGGTPPAVTDAENAVTIALRDEFGGTVAGGVKTLVSDLLTGDGERITGTLISLIDPAYLYVGAAFAVQVKPGWDPVTTKTQVAAALADFLDPATWGVDQTGEGRRRWRNEQAVRRNDLIGVAYRVEGVRHVPEMWLGESRTVTATASTDVINDPGHPFADDDPVILTALTGGAGLGTATVYYVRAATGSTYKLATNPGGAAINITTDATAGNLIAASTADVALPEPVGLPLAGAIAGTATF